MTRNELLSSKEYWMVQIQNDLFGILEEYMAKNNLNRTQLAKELNVTKGYITQVLKGDFNHKISKLVSLSLACEKVPIIHFVDLKKYIADDTNNRLHVYEKSFVPVKYFNITIQNEELENIERSKPQKNSGRLSLTVQAGTSHMPQIFEHTKS